MIAVESGFGAMLRAWRSARGQSQLALSLTAGVSARHLSYMETGRSAPSRDMVLTLAQALDVPLRERNSLLEAAGYAAVYRETPLQADVLAPVREALATLLRASEPNPVFIVNRRYDIVDANGPARWLLQTFCGRIDGFAAPFNMGRLLASPHGLRASLENWEEVAGKVLRRLRRDLAGLYTRDAVDEALLKEIEPILAALPARSTAGTEAAFVSAVRLRRDGLRLLLFTTIATLGTPLDVTLQELRIETLFPMDDDTRAALAVYALERRE
jgi:transcriptional regulator with XRE-family HTH domain